MATPNIALLTAVVLAQNAAYNTKNGAVFEKIKNYVWYLYSPTVVPTWSPVDDMSKKPDDVAGLGAAIYAVFVAAGVTSAVGGIAYWLEQLSNQVLTYPYTRATNDVLDVPTS